MLFNTSLLGEVDVDEQSIITFAGGLPAFEHCTRFKLFHDANCESPRVHWLQSLDEPDVLFSVTEPGNLGIRYEVQLDDAEVAALQLSRPEDVGVLLIIYRDGEEDPQQPLLSHLRANVRNPLIINFAKQLGMQKTNLDCDIVFHNR
ncbi:flagellar assembly protein FliW [Vogesella oryzae]|uniref:flagellar assembly protein FliW n=1 Tax=Vogesella oryzae TaxID=1735285 RepID=UPI0015838001|nr:flagellar assembly protein FliW [Vogesella oryzae]